MDKYVKLLESKKSYPELDDLVGKKVMAKIQTKGMDVLANVYGEFRGDYGEINNQVFTIFEGKNTFKLEPSKAKSINKRGSIVTVEYPNFTVIIA